MTPKYTSIFQDKYKEHVDLLNAIIEQTDRLGKLTSQNIEKEMFFHYMIQFAKIAIETPEGLICLLERGNISQCYVLLRWYLEICHLCYYLWQNPSKLEIWKKGNQISPGEVRGFLMKMKLQSWKETYNDWCNVVHGNEVFLNAFDIVAKKTPVNSNQILILGNAFLNIIVLTQKFNYVFGKALQPYIEVDLWHELATLYNKHDDKIFELTEIQLSEEKIIMEK